VRRRLTVVGVGLALGAVFALCVAGPMMPSGMGLRDRAIVWAAVMGGPVLGTIWDMMTFHPAIGLGWMGMLLVPAHLARPHWSTGLLSGAGLVLWFFAGFLAVMVAVWGA
jgi:hypothetical protein